MAKLSDPVFISSESSSSVRRFLVLLLFGFLISFVVGISAVWTASKARLDQAAEDFHSLETQAVSNWYTLQIQELLRNNQYVAARPEVVSAVLGETADLRIAASVLESHNYNPNIFEFFVVDILGDVILQRSVQSGVPFAVPSDEIRDLAERQLSSLEPKQKIFDGERGQLLIVGSPVIRNGVIEGAVLAVAQVVGFQNTTETIREIYLTHDASKSEANASEESASNLYKLELEWPDLYLALLFDEEKVQEARARIIRTLGAGLFVGLLISFAGIAWVGNSLLVAPFRLLEESQEQLRHSENRTRELAEIAELANDAIIVTDRRSRVTWMNSAASHITGYSFDEMAGQNPGHVLQGPDTSNETRAKLREAIRNGEPIQTEILNYSKSGKPYWIDLAITPDRNADGEIYRFVAVERDITQSREREDALNRAINQANAANEAKSMFLANMSHEIRTPMNGILGMLDVLEDGEITPQQLETTGVIRRSAEALVTIINDILDFSRIEAGKVDIDLKLCNVEALIYEVMALMKSSPYRQDTKLFITKDPDVPDCFLTDRARLRQVLLNVVGNALKFTTQGHVSVFMKILKHDGRDMLAIEVEDSGCGIEADKVDKVFSAFEQANNSRTRSFDGTGLGLAISRKLARLMKGDVQARSVFGVGSVFTIFLPLDDSQVDAQPAQPLAGKTAFLVLKEERARAGLEEQLGRLGMVLSVTNDETVDVVITDRPIKGPDEKLTLHCLNGRHASVDGVSARNGLDAPANIETLERKLCDLLGVAKPSPKGTERKTEAAYGLNGLNILLADDNATNRLVVRQLLRDSDAEIVEAEDGQVAVEQFRPEFFDVILMDMSMPTLSGEEATKKIREIENFANAAPTPIVALTANASQKDREACLAAGMDDFLSKPIRKKMLLQKLKEWTESKVA